MPFIEPKKLELTQLLPYSHIFTLCHTSQEIRNIIMKSQICELILFTDHVPITERFLNIFLLFISYDFLCNEN